jgi:hypothetical protein
VSSNSLPVPPKKKDNLRILTINCQRVDNKTAELAATLDYFKPDLVCGTESWMRGVKSGRPPTQDAMKSSEFFPPNYVALRNDRCTLGGGVFVLAHKSLVSTEVSEASNIGDAEIIWTKIQTMAKDLFVGSFYMPHRDISHLNCLDISLGKITEKKGRNILLCGDFNCPDVNWNTHNVPPGAQDRKAQQKLVEIAEKYQLHQVQEEPTRGDNLLDLVFTTNPTLLKASVSTPGLSDHDAVVSDFCIQPFFVRNSPRKCYHYGKAEWDKLKQAATEVSKRVSSQLADGADVNTLWKTFKEQLLKAIDQYIPSTQRTSRHSLPWFNNRLRKLLKKKQRLYNQARKTGVWTNFRYTQKECKRAFRRAEWDFLNNVITDGLVNNNSKPFWKYIKSRKQDNTGIAPLREKGTLYSDGKKKANILIEQFKSVFTQASLPAETDLPQHPSISNLTIQEAGVRKLLRNVAVSKASGPDNIPNKVLKECADELAEGLTHIFQKSVHSGCLPEDWTNANIAPVFKKGDRHAAENYRPVSLTSVACKLLERIIYGHVMSHLQRHSILTNLNHGFRAGFSCETQLVVTLHDLCRNFEQKAQTDIAILDFSKAFDTVPHSKLLEKLSSYGITGTLHEWLTSFLTKRRMKVVVEGQYSEEVTVDSGVPQGTVLGPLLFLCHINDMPDTVKSQIRLFADDCLLYRQIKSQADHYILQRDLQQLETWAGKWGMRFNANKCYILSVQNKSSHFYQLGNHILQQVNSSPYLGVQVNENLTWTDHIEQLSKRANSSLGLLKRNLRFCSLACRKTAYVSLVRSLMEYSSMVWDPHHQTDIDKLETIQRRGARFVTQDYRTRTPGCVTNMLRTLDLPPLQDRRKNQRLAFFYKVVGGQLPGIPPEMYMLPIKGKRLIKPKNDPQFRTQNMVNQMARKNTRCYSLRQQSSGKPTQREETIPQSEVYKNSFFPRTTREWNNLEDNIVTAESIEAFKQRLATLPSSN